MTTAIYVRISSDQKLDRLGVQRQRRECESLCKKNRWSPIVVYEDNDVSAYSGKTRPAYQRMLDDLRGGTVERIVAWHPDRLHRSPRELEDFIDLVDETGCAIATVMAGHYDLTTSAGRQVARILGAVARGESEHKSERIRSKFAELADQGVAHFGGARPYGYDRADGHFILNEAEAAIIREIADRFLNGEATTALVRDLAERGVATANGGQWRTQTLRGILMSPLLSGQRQHRGVITGTGTWPAILTPEETRQIRALYAVNTMRGVRRRATSQLSGILLCARCGVRMYAGNVGHGKDRYRCQPKPVGCAAMSIDRVYVDEFVADAVLDAAETPMLDKVVNESRQAAKQARATSQDGEGQLAELAAAYADKIISMSEWKIARERIRARIAGTDATPVVTAPMMRGLRDAWPSMSVDVRRATIASLVEAVLVRPVDKNTNRFDPERIEIRWRT